MYSIKEAVGTGSRITVAVPPYIDKDHIRVYVDSIPTPAFEWVNDHTIALTAPNLAKVRVVRRTSPDERLTRYMNGEALPGEALEVDSKQAFFLAQEAYDLALSAGGTAGGMPGTVTIGGVELTEEALLSILAGKVSLAHLDDSLKADVALITAGAQVPGSVAWLFSQETASREAWQAQEQEARVASFMAEAGQRTAALLAEAQARLAQYAALAAEVGTVRDSTYHAANTLQLEIQARTEALEAEAQARAAALAEEAAARLAGLTAEASARLDGLAAEAAARTAAVGAVDARVTSVQAAASAATDTVNSRVIEVVEALADRSETLARRASRIEANYKLGDTETRAVVDSAVTALTDADSALASQISTLDAAYKAADSTLTARVAAAEVAQADGDAALASQLTALDAAYKAADGTLQAGLNTANTARADGDAALASQISTLDAAYKAADGALSAGITAANTARADGDAALSTQLNALDAAYKAADSAVQVDTAAKVLDLEEALASRTESIARRVSRMEADYKEGDTEALAALESVRVVLADADSALAAEVDSLDAAYRAADSALQAGITAANTARADGDSALASQLTALDAAYKAADSTLTARVAAAETAQVSGDAALASQISTLDAAYKAADSAAQAAVSAQLLDLEEAVASRTAAVARQVSRMEANYKLGDTEALAALEGVRMVLADADSALASQVTALDAAYKAADTVLGDTVATKADASALNALSTRVTSAEDTLTSQGISLTALQNSLATTNNTVATKADAAALSELTTRVTNAEGVNTSQGTSITSLSNSVTTVNGLLRINDTRNDNREPSWYVTNYPQRSVVEFKGRTTVGAPGTALYGDLRTTVRWTDLSGGPVTQVFSPGDPLQTYTRFSTSGTTWSAWKNDVVDLAGTVATKADASALNTLSTTVSGHGTALTSQADQITALDAAYKAADSTLTARVAAAETAQVSGDAALASQVSSLDAAYKAADTSLASQAWEIVEAVADRTATLARRAERIEAGYKQGDDELAASVSALETARANGDAALASQLASVDAAYKAADATQAAATAAVQTSQTALATRVGVVEANYTLKVSATRSDGKVVLGGIGVNASANDTSGQSEIILAADKLQFVDPNTPNGTPVPLLTAGMVGGAPTLVIPAARYGDQTVPGRVIVDGDITASKIDSRGLSIKDASGNVILAAGTALDWSNVGGAGKPSFDNVVDVGEVFNSHGSIVAADGRPAGVHAMYGTTWKGVVSYADAERTIVKLQGGTDASIGCAWNAFRVFPGVSYEVKVRIKSNAASTSGCYVGMGELDAEMTQGNVYLHNGTGEDGGQTWTRLRWLHTNAAIGTAWEDRTFVYTPTSTTKWVSPFFLNWDGMGLTELHIAHVVVVARANFVDNTSQLTDGAGLGTKAVWSSVTGTGRPADNATVGATIGVNLSGQITPANATTYIANAAITNAQFGGDLYSTDWAGYGGTTGWMLERGGKLIAYSGEFRGDVKAGGRFMAGDFMGFAWPQGGMGLKGAYLGPAGLRLGNQNDGKWFSVTPEGDMSMPGMSVSGGVLSISQANVVDTVNIAGNAVTIPASAFAASQVGPYGYSVWTSVLSITITSPGGTPFFVVGSLDSTATNNGTTTRCRVGVGVNSTTVPFTEIAGAGGTTVAFSVTPPAGTVTFHLLARPASGVDAGRYKARSLFVIGTRR